MISWRRPGRGRRRRTYVWSGAAPVCEPWWREASSSTSYATSSPSAPVSALPWTKGRWSFLITVNPPMQEYSPPPRTPTWRAGNGRRCDGYTLSPSSLRLIPAGTRLVLPSPNGSRLSAVASGHGTVVAGCLRNRSAVATWAAAQPGPIGVVAAGERWADGSLRVSLEDLLGAGALISAMDATWERSPEAAAAQQVFAATGLNRLNQLWECASGRELRQRGFGRDVEPLQAV